MLGDITMLVYSIMVGGTDDAWSKDHRDDNNVNDAGGIQAGATTAAEHILAMCEAVEGGVVEMG